MTQSAAGTMPKRYSDLLFRPLTPGLEACAPPAALLHSRSCLGFIQFCLAAFRPGGSLGRAGFPPMRQSQVPHSLWYTPSVQARVVLSFFHCIHCPAPHPGSKRQTTNVDAHERVRVAEPRRAQRLLHGDLDLVRAAAATVAVAAADARLQRRCVRGSCCFSNCPSSVAFLSSRVALACLMSLDHLSWQRLEIVATECVLPSRAGLF